MEATKDIMSSGSELGSDMISIDIRQKSLRPLVDTMHGPKRLNVSNAKSSNIVIVSIIRHEFAHLAPDGFEQNFKAVKRLSHGDS